VRKNLSEETYASRSTPRSAENSFIHNSAMDSKAVGDTVVYVASLPLDANVLFITVMASKMPSGQLQLWSATSACARAVLAGAGKNHRHFTNGAMVKYCK
jgi:hypothetical protein